MKDWIELARLLEKSAKALRKASQCFSSIAKVDRTLLCEKEFSIRCWKCLDDAGIETLEDLAEKSENDLMAIRYFRMTMLVEVRNYLRKNGLTLKGDSTQ